MSKPKKQPKPRKTLLERIYQDLRQSKENEDKIIEAGSLGDNSVSWIEIRPKQNNISRGWDLLQVLTFNHKGSKLLEVNSYKIIYTITEETEIIK